MRDRLLKWKRVPTGSQPRPRHGHRAVNIEDLMIVFGGGNEGLVDELYVFNTTNCRWSAPVTKGEKPSKCAVYGFSVYGNRIFLFGGMVGHNKFSNELYELICTKWEWRNLKPEPPEIGEPPCPRLGHSFTFVTDKIYLFGGLTKQTDTDDPINDTPTYLNDLYTLDICGGVAKWEIPSTFGTSPQPRESHTGVAYKDKKTKNSNLVIYGGMSGCRLGDVWMLDTNTMTWFHPEIKGLAPLPRSLHTATLIGNRMYIFGGWIPISTDDSKKKTLKKEWECTNTLACLNLKTMTWEEISLNAAVGIPRPRAGHCSIGIHGKLYVWSGRDGLNLDWNNVVCCNDFWYVEVEPPENAPRITLVHALSNSFELKWLEIPTTQVYLLEVQRLNSPLTVPNLKVESPTSQSNMTPVSPISTLSSIKYPLVTSNPIQSSTAYMKTRPQILYVNDLIRFEPEVQRSNALYTTIKEDDSGTATLLCKQINEEELNIAQPKKCIIGGKSYTVIPAPVAMQECLKSRTQKAYSCQSTLIANSNKDNILKLSLYDRSNVTRDVNNKATEKWCTVGFFTERSCTVFNYIDYNEWNSTQYKYITYDNIPDLSTKARVNLEPRTGYKFRISAINGCGRGPIGDFISCITCLPGLPCSPTEFKISKLIDGVCLSWEQPPTISIEILEYSVYLVVKSHNSGLVLRRVYCGPQLACNIPNSFLKSAYIDDGSKPAKIFRIWARNKKGYGPFTQIRYLEESKLAIYGSSSSNTAMKRPTNKLNAGEKRFKWMPSSTEFPALNSPSTSKQNYC